MTFAQAAVRVVAERWKTPVKLSEELYDIFKRLTVNEIEFPAGIKAPNLITNITGGGGIPCKITGGSGTLYTVDLYANGPDQNKTDTVTAIQLQIAEDEAIPSGTWDFATKIADAYYLQVPVWLGDEA